MAPKRKWFSGRLRWVLRGGLSLLSCVGVVGGLFLIGVTLTFGDGIRWQGIQEFSAERDPAKFGRLFSLYLSLWLTASPTLYCVASALLPIVMPTFNRILMGFVGVELALAPSAWVFYVRSSSPYDGSAKIIGDYFLMMLVLWVAALVETFFRTRRQTSPSPPPLPHALHPH